jgi:ABC-type hemin transport system ATPase subunit
MERGQMGACVRAKIDLLPEKLRAVVHLRALEGAVLLATHDLELACRSCDRAVVLREGRVALEAAIDRTVPAESSARLLAAMDLSDP